MSRVFNPEAANRAQYAFCYEGPMFAPENGYCPNCNHNIYLKRVDADGHETGISVQEAAQRLITGCPHCNYSFVE